VLSILGKQRWSDTSLDPLVDSHGSQVVLELNVIPTYVGVSEHPRVERADMKEPRNK
jgi:hypothetical protein